MKARYLSVLSAIAASSCCVLPLILLGLTLLGIGTASLAGLSSTVGGLQIYLMPLAIVGLGFSYYTYFREKKSCQTSGCKPSGRKFTIFMLTFSTIVVTGFMAWSVYPYFMPSSRVVASELPDGVSTLAMFEVQGMTCGGCELAITGAIEQHEGVDSARSSFIDSRAVVWYDSTVTTTEELARAIQSVGYTAELTNPSKEKTE